MPFTEDKTTSGLAMAHEMIGDNFSFLKEHDTITNSNSAVAVALILNCNVSEFGASHSNLIKVDKSHHLVLKDSRYGRTYSHILPQSFTLNPLSLGHKEKHQGIVSIASLLPLD
jgi:hypothetical protein